ncbi:hypothetical protein BX600DRAFT_434762 [Xylariales sp. PMI_506]|nr:hypothetical protein BX600DRAFT_434762 [Xylariales sp. PMI_506]
MLPQSVLVFLSTIAVASARVASVSCTTTARSAVATTPTLPVNGGATELPSTNATLKHIAIGHGIQNYTCSAAGANATSAGALAVLYDLTSQYAALSSSAALALPGTVLTSTSLPLNLANPGAAGAADQSTQYAANTANPFPASVPPLTVRGALASPLPVLGHHYFDLALTPTFDLFTSSELLAGAKLADITAPATANKGIMGTGAVDWLQLGEKAGYTSVGLTVAYRVVTAGGVSLACTAAGQNISVPYAAQYWFYE